VKRIDILPDDVLLGIFDFYVNIMRLSYRGKPGIEAWQSLVHVCRRWRSLVLGSPRRLNLQLYCTPETPARDTLDVWPALPIIVSGCTYVLGTDNVITVLGQSNRVCRVHLLGFDQQSEEVFTAMQVPFPELTDLRLSSLFTTSVIPDSFLDGSAPRLRFFTLDSIPFPGLPKLLSSATHLVQLWLENIPRSGYILPEAMVALLSVLSSLRILCIGFQSHLFPSRPARESQTLPPQKCSILPTLDEFHFKGVTGYLYQLVTLIDAPQLDEIHITFFNVVSFDCSRLAQFITRTPTLRAHDEAHVQFDNFDTSVALLAPSRT
jgi:hypothetical protein